MKVAGLTEGCLLRGRPDTFIRSDSLHDLQIGRAMSWNPYWVAGEEEVLVYLGYKEDPPNNDLRRTVLWRGHVLRVNATSWRYLELATGVSPSEGMERAPGWLRYPE